MAILTARGFNRGLVAQTGQLAGGTFMRDTYSLEVKEVQSVMSEATGMKKPVLRVTGVFQKADEENQNHRYYGMSIVSEAIGAIQEDIGSRRVIGELDHCFLNSNFRVLTTSGWRDFGNVEVGDEVWSRANGKMIKSRVNAIIDQPYDGDAYTVKGRSIDAGFTPNHRIMAEKRYIKPGDAEVYHTMDDVFNAGDSLRHERIPRTAEWYGESPEFITIPGVPAHELKRSVNYYKNDITKDLLIDTKLFCAFLGIYLAEGYSSHNRVFVCQYGELRQHILDMLNKMSPDLEWTLSNIGCAANDIRLARYVQKLGNKYTKFIPQEIKNLDGEYLEELIHWFCLGDGRMVAMRQPDDEDWQPGNLTLEEYGTATATVPYVRAEVFTVSKTLIDDLHECLVKSGGCGSLMVIDQKPSVLRGRVIQPTTPLYQLHIAKTHNIYLDRRFLNITKIHHSGNIYCLGVDHGNFYVEMNGNAFWTGNSSDAKIHLDRVSHLISKVWMEGKYVYGVADIIEDSDQGHNAAALIRAGVKMGISSRGVGDMEVVNEGADNERYIVQPGYRFITWDLVADTSVQEATLSIMEHKNIPTRASRKIVKPEDALLKELDGFLKG